MGVQVNVPGACNVKVGLGSSNALVSLGYSVDGIQVSEDEFIIPVKSDRYGGSDGPNIDVQTVGKRATIEMELVEFDPEVFVKLSSRLPTNSTYSADPGRVITPGALTFATAVGGLFRCLLFGVKDQEEITANGAIDLDLLLTPRNYPFCRVIDAVSFNLGTRHAKCRLKFEAQQGVVSSNVVIWNRTTS